MGFLTADRKFERFEDVTPKVLRSENVRLLLCDLDNTLRLRSEKQPTDSLADWVEKCRANDVKVVVISNNARRKVIREFCRPLGVPYVYWAKKPFRGELTTAMKKNACSPDETVMLGDKWSTDVLAAKSARVRSWQVAHRKDVMR